MKLLNSKISRRLVVAGTAVSAVPIRCSEMPHHKWFSDIVVEMFPIRIGLARLRPDDLLTFSLNWKDFLVRNGDEAGTFAYHSKG